MSASTFSSPTRFENRYPKPTPTLTSIKAPIDERLKFAGGASSLISKATIFVIVTGFVSLVVASSICPFSETNEPDAPALGNMLWFTSFFCGILTFSGLFIMSIIWCVGIAYRKKLKEVKSGHYLARFSVSQQQWDQFVEMEFEETKEYPVTGAIIGGVLGLIIGIVMLFTGTNVLVAFCLIVGGIAIGYFAGRIAWLIQQARRRRWHKRPFSPIIGMDGLYYDQSYLPYSYWGGGLESIELTKKEGMNLLAFQYRNQTKDGETLTMKNVPVPPSEVDTARAIVNYIRKKY